MMILIAYALLTIICTHFSNAGVVINEINSDDPAKPEKNEFVELIAYGKKRPHDQDTVQLEDLSLRGHKIIVISAFQRGAKGPTIELIANLWNSRIKNSYFVFGGLGIANADLKVDNPLVTYRQKFTHSTPTLFGFFANANVYPHAVALVYQADGLPSIKLSQETPYLKLTPELKQLIKDSLIDIVIYGRRASSEQCDIFEELVPDFTGKQYLLREFDVPKDAKSDYSLNRCAAETGPMLPAKFKLGQPSPGAQNDCSGKRFIIEINIVKLTNQLTHRYRTLEEEPMEEAQCSSRLPPDEYWSIQSGLVHQSIQTEINMAKMNVLCQTADMGGDDLTSTGNNAQLLERADAAISSMKKEKVEREWETKSFFQNNWIKLMETHQKSLLPIKTITDNKVWFEYLPNTENPTTSTYRCRLCSKYFNKLGMDARYKPLLANPDGVLRADYHWNWQIIKDHAQSKPHQNIIAKLEQAAVEVLPESFKEIQVQNEQEDNKYYAVTMRMIRTVYAEMKVNLPFLSHSKIVTLQEQNGIYLGYHHYDRKSAERMTLLVSSEMHKTLIQHLVGKNEPLSIILDSSTDSGQNHYLIVYFQALEHDAPVVYFYKLIKLGADETASGLFQKLMEAWDAEPGAFIQHIRKNLRGYASDGAAVMVGRKGGLSKLLNDWTTTNLFTIHCMAHRLHLAIRSALDVVGYYKEFEDNINSVHNFYNRHGHKRKAHLRALAEAMDMNMHEVTYVFEARWIASEFHALKAINDTWYLLVTDFDAISIDPSFSDITRAQAKGLSQKMKNKNFLLALQFTCDTLQMLSHWSKRLQQRAGLLIGLENYKDQMLSTIEQLKSNPGSFISYYLNTVACSDSTTRKCSLANYHSSISVKWQTVELEPEGRVPRLDTFRETFLSSIKNEIDSYFPSGSFESFDVLAPEKLPQKESEILLYGTDAINDLALKFQLDAAATASEWTQALLQIIKQSDFCRFQKTTAVTFWQHFLKKDSGIIWGENIKKLIHIVLILPIGSADAERGFSIMNHIRTSRRSRLEGISLDALVRLRINGPNDLEQFKASEYAKAWVAENHMRTDDPHNRKKKTRKEMKLDDTEMEDDVYLPTSNLF